VKEEEEKEDKEEEHKKERIKTRGERDVRGFSVFKSYRGKMEDNLRKREILLSFQCSDKTSFLNCF